MPEAGSSERYELDISASEILQEIQKMKDEKIINSELTEEQFQAIHLARQLPDRLIWGVISKWFNATYKITLSPRALTDRYEKAKLKYETINQDTQETNGVDEDNMI